MFDNQLTTIYEHPLEEENSHDVATRLESKITYCHRVDEMSMFVRMLYSRMLVLLVDLFSCIFATSSRAMAAHDD